MCHSPDNSLKGNLAAQQEMLRQGSVQLNRMPELIAEAENAERLYQSLATKLELTTEVFQRLTGYQLNNSPDPLQIQTK